MATYYSKSKNSFYNDEITSVTIPDDAKIIENEVYLLLLNRQSEGAVISSGPDGNPIATSHEKNHIEVAVNYKGSILTYIHLKTQTWQTQLSLGIITEGNKKKLKEWMVYANKVQSVDTSVAPEIMWPISPEK